MYVMLEWNSRILENSACFWQLAALCSFFTWSWWWICFVASLISSSCSGEMNEWAILLLFMLPRLLINFISYNLLCAITALKMSAQINRVRRLEPEKSVLFICDVQERFRSVSKWSIKHNIIKYQHVYFFLQFGDPKRSSEKRRSCMTAHSSLKSHV